MSVKMRQLVEKEIATQVIDSLLAAGFAIEVNNGYDDPQLPACSVKEVILQNMFLTDEDYLVAVTREGKSFGWVRFIYGNDGWDVINDYTVNLESVIGEGTATQKVIDKYAD